ncbi:MAG: putative membrane protein [Parvicellaceae bacterium]|jgi:uncharacterized membrane protein
MKSKVIMITILAAVLVAGHMISNAFILKGHWQFNHLYWIDAVILVLSILVIAVVSNARKNDDSKTAITYSYMSIAKLLGIAVVALIMSKQLLDEEKIPFAVHFLSPALVFIVLELIIVKGYISFDEKNKEINSK